MSTRLIGASADSVEAATAPLRALDLPPRPRNRARNGLAIAAFALFTIATCVPAIGGIEVDLGALVRNWSNGSGLLVQLIQPDFSFLPARSSRYSRRCRWRSWARRPLRSSPCR
ncbi:MAG: hypothetical protein ACJLS2_03400 [Microcella pacifica]